MDFCLIAAGSFSWGSLSSWWAIAQMALGLGAVIFVHELGHFLVAKACGVKCEKFYLGFDAFDIKIGRQVIIPRSLLKWTWGETQYGIGILPLGGYVKMLGQDDNPSNIANERDRSEQPHHEATHEVSAAGLDLEATAVGPIDRSKLDPRSYQAKSVAQRMAIISAGVIMNLIFSVIFAAIAFRNGVNYLPPIVGQTAAGGPAFAADLYNVEILKVNDVSTTDRFYSFDHHFGMDVVLNGTSKPMKLELRSLDDNFGTGKTFTKEVTPSVGFNPVDKNLAAIGMAPAMTTTLGSNAILPEQAIARANPPIKENDKVVDIDGIPVNSLADMKRILSAYPEREVKFVVERPSEKMDGSSVRVETDVPPNPMVEFGFAVEIGPIRYIQDASPAASSDLKVGDVLQMLNGQPIGDPTRLQSKLLNAARNQSPVKLSVKRLGPNNASAVVDVDITPRMPRFGSLHGNMLVAVDSLGIAFAVTNNIASVEPNSPAETAGFKPGDQLVSAKFLFSDEMKKNPFFTASNDEVTVFDKDELGWVDIFDQAQSVRPPQPLNVKVNRNGQETTLTVTPELSADWFSAHRGMRPMFLERNYVAASWWESIKLGFAQTRRDLGTVFKTLTKLIRGEVALKHLGGPGTIATVATSEASQGSTRLLLFLTMLGANLAILNFLPIPILDGGHMMFLAYEGIFRRPVNERVQIILSFMGLFFIVGLMILAISLDINRFLL